MVSEENPAGRFHRTAAPALPPGTDFLTGTSIGPFIDTGRTVQFRETGRVYLAFDTIRELADAIGLFDDRVSKETADRLAADYDTAYREGYADALKENLGGHALDLLAELLDSLRGGSGVALPPAEEGVTTFAGSLRDDDDVLAEAAPAPDRVVDPVDDGIVGPGDAPAEPAPPSGGEGDGPRRKRRSTGVSGDSSDGANPFRI